MNTTKNNIKVLWEDVLYEFSLAQEIPDRAHLEEFIGRYPEFAERLTKIAVELAIDAIGEMPMPDDNERKTDSARVSPAVSRAMSHFQNLLYEEKKIKASNSEEYAQDALDVARAISMIPQKEYRDLATNLGVNVVFLNKVRDGQIKPETYPNEFAPLFASKLNMETPMVAAFLCAPPEANATPRFHKADGKPITALQESFQDAVKKSGLTMDQQSFLLGLR